MKRTILRAFILAAAVGLPAVVGVVPAQAATSVSIHVYQCSSSSCSSKTAVTGGAVHGFLQVQATPSSGLLVSWKSLQIDVKPASSSSVCLYHRATPSGGSTYSATWYSPSYPAASSGCPTSSLNGKPTANESAVISVTGVDNNNAVRISSVTVSLNNAPSTPQWNGSPSVSGAQQRLPVVTLKWNAVSEPDVVEYRFLRTDPSGQTLPFPVSASNSSQQGCNFDGTTYTCYDTDFPSSGFGGTYSYSLVSLRPSPVAGETCYFTQGNCVSSPQSSAQSVSITEPPAPSPTPTASSGGGSQPPANGGGGNLPGVTPTGVPSVSSRDQQPPPTHVLGQTYDPNDCFTCGTYKKTLPYGSLGSLPGDTSQSGAGSNDQQRPVLAAGSGVGSESAGRDPRQLWVSVAAGLVLLLTAGHVARVLRATAS